MRPIHVSVALLVVIWSSASAQNQVVSMGYDIPVFPTVAPGQVITLFVRGLKAADAAATGFPLPTSLSDISVRVTSHIKDYPELLPIFSLRSYDFCAGRYSVPCPLTHVTVQIPTEPTCIPSGLPNDCTIGPSPVITLTVEEDGVAGQEFPIIVVGTKPQILNACQTIFGNIGGICYPFVTHADGTRISGNSPAKPGETIAIYAVGLGPTSPSVKTGEAATIPVRVTAPYDLTISYRLELPPASPAPPVVWIPEEQWITPVFVGLVPGYVGLYQMNVTLPNQLPQRIVACEPGDFGGNTRIAIGGGTGGPADGTAFVDVCVQP